MSLGSCQVFPLGDLKCMATQRRSLFCHLALPGSWTYKRISSDVQLCFWNVSHRRRWKFMSSSPLTMHSMCPAERPGKHSRASSLRSFIFAHRAVEEDGDIWSDRADGRQEFDGEAGRRVEGAFKRMRYPLYIDSGAAGRLSPLPNAYPNEPMPALRDGVTTGCGKRSRGIFLLMEKRGDSGWVWFPPTSRRGGSGKGDGVGWSRCLSHAVEFTCQACLKLTLS